MRAPSQDANRRSLTTGTTCHELLDESAHSHKHAFVWNCRTIRRCRGERDTASFCANGRLSGSVTESHFFVAGIICYSAHNETGRLSDDKCPLINCITLCHSQHLKYAALVLCCRFYSLLLSELANGSRLLLVRVSSLNQIMMRKQCRPACLNSFKI